MTAVRSGEPEDFDNIPLGGTVKLSGPQGGLAFDLEGTASGPLTIPPSPALASAERAGKMVEDYWMALARDIPFSQYGNEPITEAAITDLNKLSDFRGPKVNGKVTAATLFRGLTPGDLIGPYLFQFFLLPVSFGTLSVAQKYNTYVADKDYLTDFASWLAVQNGQGPFPVNDISPTTTYLKNGRDLGAWTNRSDLRKAPGLGEGHGVIAGACVTALKAFFDESFVIPKSVVASDDGQSSLAYNGPDAGQMKVGGELNKLANNVA